MKKIFLITILLLLLSTLVFSKNYYIVTLKNGTTIKADAVAKFDGYLKVYKYGGYIIYPQKSVKSIKFITLPDEITSKDNSSNNGNKKCGLEIKNFKSFPYFNASKGIFNVKVKGIIINNCEDTFNNVKLLINFMNKKRKLISKKEIIFDEILPLSKKEFNKLYDDLIADNISYFIYELNYRRGE